MITLLYGSVLGLLLLALTFRVVYLRRTLLVGIGAGEHRRLEKAIRAHANLIEYVPFALIPMLLLEQQGAPPWQLHALGRRWSYRATCMRGVCRDIADRRSAGCRE